MPKLYVMYNHPAENDFGEGDLWFNEKMECIDGYNHNDAQWRHEYMHRIFESVGVTVEEIPFDKKVAKTAIKRFGF